MDTVEVTGREMPADAQVFDLKIEAARLEATRAYLGCVVRAALFEDSTDELLREVREAILRFPMIYDAKVKRIPENGPPVLYTGLRVYYMTWDDHAKSERLVRILEMSPDLATYETTV